MAGDGVLERLLGATAGSARMFGAMAGDMVGSLERRAALPKIDLRKRLGPNPDVDEAYELVTSTMQRALDKLAAERRVPVLG